MAVAHHEAADGVWLVAWRSVTGRPRMAYEEGIEEALCVGWIDFTIRRMDDECTRLLLPGRGESVWSAPNKARGTGWRRRASCSRLGRR